MQTQRMKPLQVLPAFRKAGEFFAFPLDRTVCASMQVLIKEKSFTIQRAYTQSAVREEKLQGAARTKQF